MNQKNGKSKCEIVDFHFDLNVLLTNLFINHLNSGESFYTCVWMKRRSANTLEFQFGAKSSPNLLAHLCDDQHFTSNNWITQGRKLIKK